MKPFDIEHIGETLYGTTKWKSHLCRDLTTLLPDKVHREQLDRWLEYSGRKKVSETIQKELDKLERVLFELVELKLKEMKRLVKK